MTARERASGLPLARRNVALSRPRLETLGCNLHFDLVDLAVAFGRRKADQVLAVQLVGDLRECRGEVLAKTNLGVSTAGFFSDSCQARIGKVRHQRGLQTAGTEPRHLRPCT